MPLLRLRDSATIFCTYVITEIIIIILVINWLKLTTTTAILWPLYRTSALAGTSSPSYEPEDFVGVKFYCLHALADGN